jgi:hypothetical protein
MNKNLIAAFGAGALVAGLVGYVASRPSGPEPAQEVVVARVEEPQKETLPAADEKPAEKNETNPTPAATPRIETPHRVPRTVEPPVSRMADAPATAPAPVKGSSGESPKVEVFPFPSSVGASQTPVQAPVQNEPKPAEPAPKKREAQTVTIKEGTVIAVRTSEVLSSERQQSGDNFTAALAEPIIVDGFVLAERGSRVTGRIVESLAAGKVKGVARLSLELTQVQLSDGQRLTLATDPFLREGQTSKKSDAAKVGAGAAIGAALGGIFGGGKGAAIGGAAGAGAGGGAVVLTRGKPVEIESEARLPFRVSRNLTVTERL